MADYLKKKGNKPANMPVGKARAAYLQEICKNPKNQEGTFFLKPFPYIEISEENYPRISYRYLCGESTDQNLYGPFLPDNGITYLVEFLIKTFKLRTCDVDITIGARFPCTQYLEYRCLAPCVKSICSGEKYLESVALAKLFLSGDKKSFFVELSNSVQQAVKDNRFEDARDLTNLEGNVNAFWGDKKNRFWEDNLIETLSFEFNGAENTVTRVIQKGLKVFYKSVDSFPASNDMPPEDFVELISWMNAGLVKIKELRLSIDIKSRKALQAFLSGRHGRKVKVFSQESWQKSITAERAKQKVQSLKLGRRTYSLAQFKNDIKERLAADFKLLRIECFDVSHISGRQFVAGRKVFINGQIDKSADLAWILPDYHGEIQALVSGVEKRLEEDSLPPEIILLDGGPAQLNAVSNMLRGSHIGNFILAGAVKPPMQHSHISRFILEDGSLLYDDSSMVDKILKLLRDETHLMVNQLHSILRSIQAIPASASLYPENLASLKLIPLTVMEDAVKFSLNRGMKYYAWGDAKLIR